MTRQSAEIGVDFKENVDNVFVLPAPNIIKPCHDQTNTMSMRRAKIHISLLSVHSW